MINIVLRLSDLTQFRIVSEAVKVPA